MTVLTHRERVNKALNHEEADRVPRDLGGAGPANINITAYARLVEHWASRSRRARSAPGARPSRPPFQRRYFAASISTAGPYAWVRLR